MTVTAQALADEIAHSVDIKMAELESLGPDNYRSAMFLNDVEAAVRKNTIGIMKSNITELKQILKVVHFLATEST